MKKPPRIPRYASGGETVDQDPRDYSKAKKEDKRTKDELLRSGYSLEKDASGKEFFVKTGQSTPSNDPPRQRPTITNTSVKKGMSKPPRRFPPTNTPATNMEEIVFLEPSTPPPPMQTQPDVQIERNEIPLGDLPYKAYDYPDVNAGYSKGTRRAFYKDPNTGQEREIDEFESMKTGTINPVYKYPEGDERGLPTYGTVKNRSLNTNSVLQKDLKTLEDYDKKFVPQTEQSRAGFSGGGKVFKMKKAPRMNKGGKMC